MMLYRRDYERELHLLRAELKDTRSALEAAQKAPWSVPPRGWSGFGVVVSVLAASANLYLWGASLELAHAGGSAAMAWVVVAGFHYQNFKRAPKRAKGH